MTKIYVAAVSAANSDPMVACEQAYAEANTYLRDYQEEAAERGARVRYEFVPQMVMHDQRYCYTLTIISYETLREKPHDSSSNSD